MTRDANKLCAWRHGVTSAMTCLMKTFWSSCQVSRRHDVIVVIIIINSSSSSGNSWVIAVWCHTSLFKYFPLYNTNDLETDS